VKKVIQPTQQTRVYHLRSNGISATTTTGTQNSISVYHITGSEIRQITTLLAAEPITLPTDFVLDIKKWTSRYEFQNATNNVVYMQIYKWTARKDTDNVAGSPSEPYLDPSEAWIQGLIDQGMTADFTNQIGVTPFESHAFGVYVKVTKVMTKKLGIGGTFSLGYKTKDLKFSKVEFTDTNSALFAKRSKGYLIVFRGWIASIASAATASQSLAKIAYNARHRIVVRNSQDYLPDKQLSFISGSELTTAPTVNVFDTQSEAVITT